MLVIVGLDYKSTPEEIRERAAFTKKATLEALRTLKESVEEAIILSTCNRSEIYIYTGNQKVGIDLLKSFYENRNSELSEYLYSYTGREALIHLFRLACGLESMILGEDQILGQIKEAEELSRENGYSGKYLSQFFREVITFSKRIKTQYKLSEVPISLPSSAVKYIKRHTRDYSEKRILLVGTGKMGCLVLKHLEAEGFEKVTICNRTYHNNESIKIPQKFKTIEYHNRYEALHEVDIVISATSSPHTVFRKEKISKIDHEILFIDLALPRDIDREILNIKNVEILGIDDFKSVIQERKTWQLEQIEYIESEIELAADNLVNWEEHTIVDPILKQINNLVSKKAEETIQILNKRYKFSGKDLKYLEKIIRSEFLRLVKPTLLKLKSLNHDEVNLINEAIKILGHKNKEGESNESSFNV